MQELGLIESFSEKISLSEDLFCQFFCFCFFFQSTECLISDFYPELLSGALKVSSCSGHGLIFVDADGECQSSVGRACFCS